MALKEHFNHYYKIDIDNTVTINNTLIISFIVYRDQEERLKEKDALNLYNKIYPTLTLELIPDEQELYNIQQALLPSLYKDLNEDTKKYIVHAINKYDILKEFKTFIENPINIVYKGEIVEYNYTNNSFTLEDAYNILKQRIGKNTDI